MMSILTPELRREVEEAAGQPVSIVDLETHQQYVLIRADVYERLRAVLEDGPFSKEEQQAVLRNISGRVGWDDPEMDVYDQMYPRK